MRFIVADWGTTRFRAYLVADGTIVDRVASEEGVSALKAGEHAGVFQAHAGHWLEAEPDLPVLLVGMVGSREGWTVAPYAQCPAAPADLAQKLVSVDLGGGRHAHIVPGLTCEPAPGAVDVMRGEETLAFGAGVDSGLVCLPGTHSKWLEMRDGRIQRFGSFMTGEMYGLLRHHSMIGRPALDPENAAGFQEGLDTAARDAGSARAGLLHLLFGARAATVAGRLDPHMLGPLISGLLTGEEVRGALALLGRPETVTIVAGAPRADLYVRALDAVGVRTALVDPEAALIRGIVRIATGLS
jgi:2-dehydro-3-deoxygalactonokinase